MSKKDFFHPDSMLTPGFAGAMVLMITNAISSQFDLSHKWVALLLSLIISFIILNVSNDKLGKIKYLIYCLLNGLIIFSVAAGGNNFGQQFSSRMYMDYPLNQTVDSIDVPVASRVNNKLFFQDWFSR